MKVFDASCHKFIKEFKCFSRPFILCKRCTNGDLINVQSKTLYFLCCIYLFIYSLKHRFYAFIKIKSGSKALLFIIRPVKANIPQM